MMMMIKDLCALPPFPPPTPVLGRPPRLSISTLARPESFALKIQINPLWPWPWQFTYQLNLTHDFEQYPTFISTFLLKYNLKMQKFNHSDGLKQNLESAVNNEEGALLAGVKPSYNADRPLGYWSHRSETILHCKILTTVTPHGYQSHSWLGTPSYIVRFLQQCHPLYIDHTFE